MLQEKIDDRADHGKAAKVTSPVFADANAAHARRAEAWLADRIAASQKLPPGEMIVEAANITPAMAEIILLHRNAGNRPITTTKVGRYAETMAEGRWRFTSQGISFSRDGKLNNGQHRLSAIIAAGRPVRMMVTFGEDRDVFAILDTGKNRTGSDTLAIAGYKNTATLAASARLLLQIESRARFSFATVSNDVIKAEVERRHPALTDATTDGMRLAKALRCSTAVCTVAVYLIEQQSSRPQRLPDFMERLETGAGLAKHDPILVLRDGLQKRSIGNQADSGKSLAYSSSRYPAQVAAIIKAWNLWLHGRRAQHQSLRLRPDEDFPLAD